MSPEPFAVDRSWQFAVGPDELWAILCRTEEYPRWWPWLARFEADGLRAGARASCVVRPPLPYTLRFTVDLEEVEPARLLTGYVRGDLEGPAGLEIAAHQEGCEARVWWRVEVRQPVLSALGRLARPVLAWGHDRVVAAGVAQFRRRALPPDVL